MLRVGVIDTTPSPPRTGGEIVLSNLCRALQKNFDTKVYRFAFNTGGSVILYPFLPLVKIFSQHALSKVDVLFAPWSGVTPVEADMIYLQPAPTQVGDPSTLARRLGIGYPPPRDLWPPPMMWLWYNRFARRYLDRAALSALERVGTVIVASDQLKGEFRRDFGRSSLVVRPCISSASFALLMRKQVNLQRRGVLSLSRLIPSKRINEVIDIANELPDIEFLVAGRSGSNTQGYLKKLSLANYSRNVRFMIDIDESTKARILSSSAVFLNTSVNETFPVTVLEAMLAGSFPVVHASGGPLDYLPPEHLFHNKDEAVARIRDAVRGGVRVDPELFKVARDIADPIRFEREIVAATEQAFRDRRR